MISQARPKTDAGTAIPKYSWTQSAGSAARLSVAKLDHLLVLAPIVMRLLEIARGEDAKPQVAEALGRSPGRGCRSRAPRPARRAIDWTVVMKAQTRPRRRSSFNRSARASASRRCSSICRPSPSWRSTGRSSRRISKACSSVAWLSGRFLRTPKRLLEPSPRVRQRRSRGRLPSGLPEIVHCFLMQRAPRRRDGRAARPARPAGLRRAFRWHRRRARGCRGDVHGAPRCR